MHWIYLGTGLLSAKFLERLIKSNLLPNLVLTGSPKIAGRGRKITHTPVFLIAHNKGLPIIETDALNDPVIIKKMQTESPSFIVVFDFGQIVPSQVLNIPKTAALNIHPSLLPKYRGAAPIIRAMMNGEKETGITIIKMNTKIDAGDIVLQEKVLIPDNITRGEIEEILLDMGCELLKKAFIGLKSGKLKPYPQQGKVTYAKKLNKSELWIDWNKDATSIKNKIHALSPIPAARSIFKDKIIQFLKAEISDNLNLQLKPGQIYIQDKSLYVGTHTTPLKIILLKPAGKKEMTAQEFINGYKPSNFYFTSRLS